MKILILGNSDIGLYKFRKELVQVLLDDQNEVFLALPEGQYIPILEEMGCVFLKILMDRRGVNIFNEMQLLIQYYRIIHRIKPDIVLTYTIKPNIYGGIICQICRMKYIANITGLGTAIEAKGILSRILLLFYKVSLNKASQVFFQNEANRMFFQKKQIVKKTRMIPGSGVNLDEHCYEEYPEKSEQIRFLYVGRIMKDKGIEELLVGAEQLKKSHPNISIELVGGYDEESYRDKIGELERKGIIKYLGEHTNVHSIMKVYHAIIMPSYHEGLSNVLLEAAACGRPVLATNVPGCRETFEEGVSGFGFRPGDSAALVSVVEKFLDLSYEVKRQMGICGRKKVEAEFDRRIVVSAYMQEIKKAYRNI